MKTIQSTTLQVGNSTDMVATCQESSVEITQNAKGEPRVCVKVYHADALQAAIDAVQLYKDVLTNLREMKNDS